MSGEVVPQKSPNDFQTPEAISYLTQKEAAEIDEILMGPLGFSVDQLMVNCRTSSPGYSHYRYFVF